MTGATRAMKRTVLTIITYPKFDFVPFRPKVTVKLNERERR